MRRTAVTALMISSLTASLAAEAPVVDRVTPNQGVSDEATVVRVEGSFAPGAHAAWLDGGPFEAARVVLPSGAAAVCVEGDRVYVAFYDQATKLGGIHVFDVSDPADPNQVGTFQLGDSGSGVAFASGYAYMNFLNPYTFIGGMHIVGLDDESRPLLMGSVQPLLDPHGVVVRDGLVYIADSLDGFKVADVSDPESAQVIGSYDTPGLAWDVELEGDTAYLADGFGGLMILDVADPAAPAPLGSFTLPGSFALGIDVQGETAYLADFFNGLIVLDVSDPTAPRQIARVPAGNQSTSVQVVGDRAFVGDGFGGLKVLDVSDPEHPVILGGAGAPGSTGYFFDVAVGGDHVYVADNFTGLRVYDVSSPTAPPAVGSLLLDGPAQRVAYRAGRAYVLRDGGVLDVIDLADPADPVAVGTLELGGTAEGIQIVGGTVYAATGSGGLRLVDVSDPRSPTLAGSLSAVRATQSVAVAGGLAFLGDSIRRMEVVDISDPSAPRRLGWAPLPDDGFGVAVEGSRAYVASDFRGLQIFDVSTPDAPQFLGKFDTSGRATAVAVANGVAYVADGNRGISVIDVSDPSATALLATIGTQGNTRGVTLDPLGPRLVAAIGLQGVAVYDVSDPARPKIIERHDTPGEALRVATDGVRIFTADRGYGLQVLSRNPALVVSDAGDGAALQVTVPAGFTAGPYDVTLIAEDGLTGELPNAFRVCPPAQLISSLVPAALELAAAPQPFSFPTSWSLIVTGASSHQARLRLPELTERIDYETAGPVLPGRESVEIELAPQLGQGVVRFVSEEPERLRQDFAGWVAAGGIPLTPVDEQRYAPIELSMAGGAPAGGTSRGAVAINPKGEIAAFRGSHVYRYEWVAGKLTAAGARGPNVDHLFDSESIDATGCSANGEASYREALGQLCRAVAASRPDLALRCDRGESDRSVHRGRMERVDRRGGSGPTDRLGR